MELSRRHAPLYGQVEAYATFRDPAVHAEETDFYVVLEGSTLTHVTVARRRSGEGGLGFMVPGHNVAEVVSVWSYSYREDGVVRPCGGGAASLEYVMDAAQRVADHLHANRRRLEPRSHLELQGLLRPGPGGRDPRGAEPAPGPDDGEGLVGLRELDLKVTEAMANMEALRRWSERHGDVPLNGDGPPRSEGEQQEPRETLLHLAVRQDLRHLSRFLLRQPGGHMALTSPNQEGDTPLQLAQRSGEPALLRTLSSPLVPAAGRVVGGHCLWSDRSEVLRFHPGTGHLTLSAPRGPGPQRPHDDVIAALRHRLGDPAVLRAISSLSGGRGAEVHDQEQSNAGDGDLWTEPDGEQCGPPVHSLPAEQLVLSLDEDQDTESPSLLPVAEEEPAWSTGTRVLSARCGPPVALDRTASPASGHAHPSPAEGGSWQRVEGVTTDCSPTDFRAPDREHPKVPPCATDTPPPPRHHPEFLRLRPLRPEDRQHPSPPPLPPASPSAVPCLPGDHLLSGSDRSSPENLQQNRQASPTLEAEDLSPSLVALEMDSEEEGLAGPRPPPFSDLAPPGVPNGPGGAVDPSPADATCARTKSASSACDATPPLEPGDHGLRLRSYSYSSAKVAPRPSRGSQDSPPPGSSPDGVFHNFSYSRSLLQALSLSKSLSLLHPGKQRAVSLSEQPQEKRIEEEEFDKYNIPSKTDSDKYKVIRTFSFLKNRMTSTRNKSKGKGKDREAKERQVNGHQFATGSCLGPTVCLICEKPASSRDLLHCSRCMSMVHKGCKDSVPPCLKKPQDKYAVSMVKNRTASLPQNFTMRDGPLVSALYPNTMSLPVTSPKQRREGALLFSPLAGSVSSTSDRQSESSETEADSWRIFNQSEELAQTAASSTSTDSSIGEDCVDSYGSGDLTAGALELEAESWSLCVDHNFCKQQDQQEVKRQDVIYELMQTEVHHLQTLHIMAAVFRRGVREEVQLDAEAQERLFPCLDQLLSLHQNFFSSMRERRHASASPPEHSNYLIQQIGDLLLHQFTDENAERMKQVYGEFCSHHNDAVSFFKELQQNNKRFQNFVKQQSNNSLVRRREIPECILLVTQRITKYPVLLERILKYTQEATREHADLLKALAQVREVIAAVDLRVSEYERVQRLQELCGRTENRSTAKLKSGHVFRRQDMMRPGQVLKHQGPLLWKTATGRLKDVMALLLTDTLVFLQEKDQKYVFAAVDQKPPVISLQKLIVREVANEERGMFLISASAAGPEMYEVHAAAKEDRNAWMRLIREAVESCPEEEDDYTSESEDEKRAAEARVQKIHKLQESLMTRDQQICTSLEEKLQIYAESIAHHWKMDVSQLESRIRVQPQADEVPQAAVWLTAALQETENLKALLSPQAGSPSSPGLDAGSDSVFPPSPLLLSPLSPPPHGSGTLCEEEEEEEEQQQQQQQQEEQEEEGEEEGDTEWSDVVPLSSPSENGGAEDCGDFKVAQSVQSLTQLLYSLQAALTIQDSCQEVHRLLLSEAGRPPPSSSTSSSSSSSVRGQRPPHHASSTTSSSPSPSSCSSTSTSTSSSSSSATTATRGPSLQEQEKQRNLEKRREEAAAALRLQCRLRQERQRWEKECQARLGQQEALQARLEERERRCGLRRERLGRERRELEAQLEEYQRSLERLRDGQRAVERERLRLDAQRGALRGWRRGRQGSLPGVVEPALVIPLGEGQLTDTGPAGDYKYGGSVFVNEAALAGSPAPNNHHKRHDPSAHNSLNALLVRSTLRQQAGTRAAGSQNRVVDTGFFYQPAGPATELAPPSAGDYGSRGEDGLTTSPGPGGQYPRPPLSPADPQLDLDTMVSMETESEGEEGREEENIVYL